MIRRDNQEALVAEQFGPQANAYVTSLVHATGEDLARIAAVMQAARPARMLDLGCGGGHVGFACAPFVGEVVSLDLSAEMLESVAEEARRRGITNLVTRQGSVEELPFPDGGFEAVASRLSAHHWRNVGRGLREARRMVNKGAPAVFVDAATPEDPLLDTVLQTLEMLRDPSHVRNLTVRQWTTALGEAGFAVTHVTPGRLRLDFDAWVKRIATPALHVDAIRSLQERLADDVLAHFDVEDDGSFTLDTVLIEAAAA